MASTDRDALVALLRSTGGANWEEKENWDTDADLSQWHGVEVNSQGHVVKLHLSTNYLEGSIPESLGALSELKELVLSGNKLTGSIPESLGALSELKELVLSGNELTGSIPKELGALSKLKSLKLYSNILTGHIPKELGALIKLEELLLNTNKLTGSIPKELGALSKLKRLSLYDNRLAGNIPPQLGNLSALAILGLSLNELNGPIPPELGNLGALKVLSLQDNKLTGSIPKEMGNLTALTRLWLNDNSVEGAIPKELGSLGKLEVLILNKNQLTGPIPPELGNLGSLHMLSLRNNKLAGYIPKELGALSKLERLSLYDNKLTGPIPPGLGNLAALKTLDLQGNQLSGHVPKELGALIKLEGLWLQNNEFSGLPWQPAAMYDTGRSGTTVATLQMAKIRSRGVQLGDLLALLSKLELSNRLIIDSNPWKEPPEAVVKKGMPAASEYFADLFAEGVTVRRNMIKVVLVGQEGAGKTSLRQSIRTRRPTPTSGSKESTVHIDVEEIKMDVDGVSLRIYDCAGQVANTGLLQMFLSPRAVSLLVCNTEAFGEQDGCSSDRDQLKQDLSKLQELRVCDWLRSLSFRIPDSIVVVVATKCDRAGGMAANLAGRMERAIRKWLENWSDSQMTAVRVEDGVSLTSCVASAPDKQGDAALGKREKPEESMWACDWREDMRDRSPQGLLYRVMYNSAGDLRGAAMVLPRSRNIALEVLQALESGRDPLESVHQMLLKADGPEGGEGVTSTTVKQYKGIEGLTLAELSAKWSGIVEALEGDGVKVINPGHALEGALLLREYDGSLVRHETYVFLDVTWLAKILKPLLNHRDDDDLCGSLSLGDTGITLDDDEHIASWKRFKENGVLKPALAGVLWPDGLSDYVLPTLDSLGLTHPLDGDFSAEGLVVFLRLGDERPAHVGKELDDFRRDHTAVLSVTWKIFLGVPPGAIEKVLTRCCSIGALRTFWRFGVLIQGGLGGVAAGKTFALLMEYSHEKTEIDIKVYGNVWTAAPWAALSLGVSAVRKMCSEFPGLRWRASLKCPQHGQDTQISNTATRPGDKLLLGETCGLCSPETGGLGVVAKDLLEIVDVLQSRGKIFREVRGRFVQLQDKYRVLCPEESRGLHPEQAQRRFDDWLSGMQEEVDSLLHRAKQCTEEEVVGDNAKAGDCEDVSGISAEVAKLQRLVGDLQQQLGQQHQDVRGWLGELGDKSLSDGIDADDGVLGKLHFVVAMLKEVRSEGFDTPRHACVLPPWKFAKARGLSVDEQTPEVWVKRLDEWREDDFKQGKGFFKKKIRPFLVCAHTYRLVPCGPNGQGYDIQQPRTWLRMSVSVATFALQVVCATLAAMAVVPLAGVGAAVEATASAAKERIDSMLQNQLEGLTLNDGADVDVDPQAAQLEGGAYASLREFIHSVEYTARLEIAKAERGRRAPPSSSEFVFFEQKMTQVQRHNGDAAVQWVLKGQEDAWHDAMKSAPIA